MRCRGTSLLLACLMAGSITVSAEADHFYYSGGEARTLLVDSTRALLRFNQGLSLQAQESFLSGISEITSRWTDESTLDGFMACSLSGVHDYFAFLDSLEGYSELEFVEPYYTDTFGLGFTVGATFCVAFDSSLATDVVDSIVAGIGGDVLYEVEGMNSVYVLRNNAQLQVGIVELANSYYELDLTRYSHPNFGIRPERHAYKLYDYYSANQWHIQKVVGLFNEASVWDFAGLDDTLVIAVIDDGMTSHEDLPGARVLQGRDFADSDMNPAPGPGQAHGMACAGIIGASHETDSVAGLNSSTGVISLYPSVEILPVKIFSDGGSGTGNFDSVAAAIVYAYQQGAHVISNSWGYRTPEPLADVISDAISMAALFGRAGRGCPVIFSSGNFDKDFPGVAFLANHEEVISVGALEVDDSRWGYTSHGPTLDLAAPSGNTCLIGDVWTLDQMSTAGYNPFVSEVCWNTPVTWNCGYPNDYDYDCNFGGTSAACPVVSGTAALVLARDTSLTGPQVKYILEQSAVTDLDWGTMPDTPHVEYGYGRVDAFRAVLSISRGDADNDGFISDSSDLGKLVNYLFGSVDMFPSNLLGDVNCDGTVDSSDLGYLAAYLFAVPPGSEPAPENPCFKFGT